VRVSYQVTFDAEHRDRWFSHDNYVGLLCDRLRSLVRGRARQLPLVELWPNLPIVVRDLILGERTEAGRKGRLFPENGMHVTEVEVLSSDILDTEIAQLLETVQRESVSLVIHDRQAAEQLRSLKLRHEFEREAFDMDRETRERHARLDELVRTIEHDARLANIKGGETERRAAAELEAARQELVQAASLKRDERDAEAQITALKARTSAQLELDERLHREQQAHRQALSAIEAAALEAASRCTVAERQAVQPALVEALTGLGDKILLGEVAANMNLVSLFKGRDVASIFADVLGGTKVGRTIAQMLPGDGNGANDTTTEEG
jgi:major vault protein